uniref:ATP synthase subunit a n=1 Tax=Cylindricascospora bacillispora TaxID=51660 RepID=C3W8H6_9SACH|nr:ATP synthase subunit 6 [Nakaseomyces bacillisporus]CAX36944.1 ATP synthase subunit 6 [Nakaseomyces bacillisporus]
MNNNFINTFINSPLEQFEIKTFMGFTSPIINLTSLNITTFSLYIFIVFLVINVLYILTNNNNKVIGSRWLLSQEMIYDTILKMTKEQIGGKLWGNYFPLIYTFFMFIFTANLISMIPYSFALTAHFVLIISLSIIIWLGITTLGLVRHGLGFFALFVPQGTPLILVPLLVLIEVLSYSARAVSLGLRLSCNVLAGHLLMAILATLTLSLMSINIFTLFLGSIPMVLILAIFSLEMGIAMIQAYVFSILMASYIKDALYLH